MTKYFCDICGIEMNAKNTPCSGRSAGRVATVRATPIGKLEIEIMHYFEGTANGGCVCKYCLIDALKELDDRLCTEVLADAGPKWNIKLSTQEEVAEDAPRNP